jgi:two-component system, OmpR family, phosphate regulon response regulator OmpR
VVDDDLRLRDLLARYLSDHGWLVTTAKNVADARAKLHYFTFDLIILDVMMPKETGIEFATTFRKEHNTPILMLTAMGEAIDRIAGLEAGADDYLPKPFEPRELVLRTQSILSRTMPKPELKPATVMFGAYQLETQARRLLKAGQPVHVTESEMALLMLLASQLNVPISREQLSEFITSPEEEPNPRSADVMITRLRKKIEDEPSKPVYIQTVRGEGYVLRG